MKCPAQRKCRQCKEFFRPDHRNRPHQRYCSKASCRQQSKAEAQRRWLQKPENQGHFRGSENSQRVKAWRQAHPGYWRKGKPQAKRPLQDLFGGQLPENEQLTKKIVPSALPEDIAEIVHRLQRKGQAILGTNATGKPS